MLWRTHFLRTLPLTVSLKSEVKLQPKGVAFTTSKQNLHSQSNNLQCLTSQNVPSFLNIKRRFASTETFGFDYIHKNLAKFTSDKLTSLPTIEELTKTLTLEHCMPLKFFQNGLLYLHDYCGLPWWSVITIGAITCRLLLLPLAVVAERNNARIANSLPQLQFLQLQLDEAKQCGEHLKAARLTQEISLFKNHKKLSLRDSFIVTAAQAPLLALFLASLRGMLNAPLHSFSDGGLLWFSDLTAADSTYVLPLLTSATLCIIIELALRNAKFIAYDKSAFYILRACPFIILPFTMHFSAALLFYLTCNNFVILAQAAIFQIPAVRQIFKIEKIMHYLPNAGTTLLKKESKPKLNEIMSQEFEVKQRLGKMRFSKVRKDPTGKHSSALQIENVPPIPQRLKLKAIMEATKIKF